MGIEVNSVRAVCSRCGTDYSRQKGYFPVSYAALHKGVGHTHVCRDCIDALYNDYLARCKDQAISVRQVCRKLDLYWSEKAYQQVEKKSTPRSIMTQYISKINGTAYLGKSYDDTLLEEGTMWSFGCDTPQEIESPVPEVAVADDINVPAEVVAFWGPGLEPAQYEELEQRRAYWMSRLPKDIEFDIGTEAIIKQLCSLELDINRDRAAGRSVDKSINSLIALLGSAKLKPTQKKNNEADAAIDNTPFGVWIRRWENQRPIPEPDPELKDVDGIIRYISIWYLGHLCKMLGIKNTYCKLYEEELAKMRVEHPEYEDEDDEALFSDIFGASDSDDSEPTVEEK